MSEEYREVDFEQYCPKCKHEKMEETKEPCNGCLGEPVNHQSSKPTMYKEKG